uniref:THUMP domain-containing protein n=1 Tax=Parastrongyloides trichosuri TaxID=131310 RepID=A0A0N4ZQV7_PARTI
MVEPPKKRRRQNYNGKGVNSKKVESGIYGLFFTCDGHEKEAIGEAKNLIDFAVQEIGVVKINEKTNDNDKKEDIDLADALEKEINEENNKNKKGNKAWSRQKPTGCKNCLFLTTPQIDDNKDVYKICDEIVKKCQESFNTRFLQKIMPVEMTCDVDEESIKENIKTLILEHFDEESWMGYKPTYAINFRARNTDKIKRDWIIEVIGIFIKENFPNCKVNLNKPDLMININVICKSVFLSIVQNYGGRRKLSLRPNSEAELNVKVNEKKESVKEDKNSE